MVRFALKSSSKVGTSKVTRTDHIAVCPRVIPLLVTSTPSGIGRIIGLTICIAAVVATAAYHTSNASNKRLPIMRACYQMQSPWRCGAYNCVSKSVGEPVAIIVHKIISVQQLASSAAQLSSADWSAVV